MTKEIFCAGTRGYNLHVNNRDAFYKIKFAQDGESELYFADSPSFIMNRCLLSPPGNAAGPGVSCRACRPWKSACRSV